MTLLKIYSELPNKMNYKISHKPPPSEQQKDLSRAIFRKVLPNGDLPNKKLSRKPHPITSHINYPLAKDRVEHPSSLLSTIGTVSLESIKEHKNRKVNNIQLPTPEGSSPVCSSNNLKNKWQK